MYPSDFSGNSVLIQLSVTERSNEHRVNDINVPHLAYLIQHRISILGFPEVTIVQKAVMQAKQGENNKI